MKRVFPLLLILSVLVSCMRDNKSEDNQEELDTSASIQQTESLPSHTPLWTYQIDTDSLIQSTTLDSTETDIPHLLSILNAQFQDQVRLDIDHQSLDTVYIHIDSAQHFTQQMGTAGAHAILEVSTYTLTENSTVKYVHFSFQEGDHASPGTYSRSYFAERKIK